MGKPVIEEILQEREARGSFEDLADFINRTSGHEVNKRAVENFIKSGAFDSFPANRRQMMMVYGQIMDDVAQKKKKDFAGQISLFDFAAEEDKAAFKINIPKVSEYGKEDLLAFEKEVLGFYISGHPLEEYEDQWKRGISHVTTDFLPPEEGEEQRIRDGERAIVGGMITSKTMKATKNNKMMAFITVEDLVGSVEVIVFPRDYEKNASMLNVDSKVFVSGRISAEEDRASKLILEKIVPFDIQKKELWIQFSDMEEYNRREQELYRALMDSEGEDEVIIYVRKEKKKKILPASRNVHVSDPLLEKLYQDFGEKNVKAVQKRIENVAKMN